MKRGKMHGDHRLTQTSHTPDPARDSESVKNDTCQIVERSTSMIFG